MEQWAEGWIKAQMLKAQKHEADFGLKKPRSDFKRWYHSVWLGNHATLNTSQKTHIIQIFPAFLLITCNTNQLVLERLKVFNRCWLDCIPEELLWGMEKDVECNYHSHGGKHVTLFPTSLCTSISEKSCWPCHVNLSFPARILEGLLHV